jgi:hypothetical protein
VNMPSLTPRQVTVLTRTGNHKASDWPQGLVSTLSGSSFAAAEFTLLTQVRRSLVRQQTATVRHAPDLAVREYV